MNNKILESDGLKWKISTKLGNGSFGEVYKAKSIDNNNEVAIKFVDKTDGARRELLFEDLSDAVNVVRTLATGEYENKFFIVMELAGESLREKIRKQKLTTKDVIKVLRDSSVALGSISGQIVHRDIKPDNILLMDEVWCLSDFGIARFAEQSTATNTFKHTGTSAYVAPERWRGERATTASDIYSLGVTAFEIVEGKLPFDIDADLSDSHQKAPIPPFSTDTNHILASLISKMMSKIPNLRPTPERILEVLDSIRANKGDEFTLSSLQEASKSLSAKKQAKEAEEERLRAERERKENFEEEAKLSIVQELEPLKNALVINAAEGQLSETPIRTGNNYLWNFSLGDAYILVETPRGASELGLDSTSIPFDIPAITTIHLRYNGVTIRSHSIWFCDLINKGDYGCFELAFMEVFSRTHNYAPFASSPDERSVQCIFSSVMGGYQLARNPFRIEDNQVSFMTRWAGYLSDAAGGSYRQPGTLPEEDVTTKGRR